MSHRDTAHIVRNILDYCSTFTFTGGEEMKLKMNEGTTIPRDNRNYLGPATNCDIAEDSNIHLLR